MQIERPGSRCAGTGKTKLLVDVIRQWYGKKVIGVTASTGIAATHLPGGMTIRRYCGIQDGRFSAASITEKLLTNDDYTETRQRIQSTDILIIDEISMISAHIFDLVEQVFRGVRNSNVVFGGVQVILCGDLHQLKPVPNVNIGDHGHYIITSAVFKQCMPHRFILTTVHRQHEADLMECIKQVSVGSVDQPCQQLLKRMQRRLPPGHDPVKLFALTCDVEKCNSDHLLDMPEPDPKRHKTIEYPCGICGLESVTSCVGCDQCDKWFHYKCLRISARNPSLKADKWFCPQCKCQ